MKSKDDVQNKIDWSHSSHELGERVQEYYWDKEWKYGDAKLPDPVRFSRYRAQELIKEGEGVLWRLAMSVTEPLEFYTLHTNHLLLDKRLSSAWRIFDDASLELWKSSIKTLFTGPFWARFEVGDCGRLHVHVVAPRGSWRGPELPPSAVKRVFDLIGLADYLGRKPAFPNKNSGEERSSLAIEAAGAFLLARDAARAGGKRLPNRRLWRGLDRSKTVAARGLSCLQVSSRRRSSSCSSKGKCQRLGQPEPCKVMIRLLVYRLSNRAVVDRKRHELSARGIRDLYAALHAEPTDPMDLCEPAAYLSWART